MEKIFDKFTKKAADTYYAASKATGRITKEIKLRTQMSENKHKIQELYEEIGKTIYEKYVLKEENNIDKDLLNNCSMIDILADETEDIRMELLKLKNLKQCENCHYEIDYEFNYCPNCGYIQENVEDMKDNKNVTITTTDNEDEKLKENINLSNIDDSQEE